MKIPGGVIRAGTKPVYAGMSTNKTRAIAVVLSFTLAVAVPAARAQKTDPVATQKPEAQTVGDKRYDAAKELARMTKRYGLTSDQKAKIQPLLVDQQHQVHVLGADESLNDMQWAAAVHRVHGETVEKVNDELTPVQQAKYAKDEAKREKSDSDNEDDGPPFGMPPGGPPPGPM